MDDQRPTPGRAAAWTVLAGLWFGAAWLMVVATLVVVTRDPMALRPRGYEMADFASFCWVALFLAGGGAWWMLVERRGATDVGSATLAGAVAGVATPWTAGVTSGDAYMLLRAANRVVVGFFPVSAPGDFFSVLAPGPLSYVVMLARTGLAGWALVGVPAVVAGAVVGRPLGTVRRQAPPSVATRPGLVGDAVARRLPDVTVPPATLGAVAFGLAGAVGTIGLFRAVLYSPIPSLAMLSAGTAAATTGGFAVRWLHATDTSGLRAGVGGAVAGAAAVLFGGWLLFLAGQAVRPGVVGEVEAALAVPAPFLLQFGAVAGGVLTVALVEFADPQEGSADARDRHPDDAARGGTRRTRGE
jgi:hypothetical protein